MFSLSSDSITKADWKTSMLIKRFLKKLLISLNYLHHNHIRLPLKLLFFKIKKWRMIWKCLRIFDRLFKIMKTSREMLGLLDDYAVICWHSIITLPFLLWTIILFLQDVLRTQSWVHLYLHLVPIHQILMSKYYHLGILVVILKQNGQSLLWIPRLPNLSILWLLLNYPSFLGRNLLFFKKWYCKDYH